MTPSGPTSSCVRTSSVTCVPDVSPATGRGEVWVLVSTIQQSVSSALVAAPATAISPETRISTTPAAPGTASGSPAVRVPPSRSIVSPPPAAGSVHAAAGAAGAA
eukprot:CAMPEP_0179289296 /NCGR_PEP_ID=MMETSP0797-20121207/41226_1 /TAXON_ID=47934 /ORGANISM="Dinophysis acuminata, Strain DAEP01" /LENGTH=104 /DNA_ID=CAMNT_0020998291 /DNA_START=54 /DNA_END=365 /DNA_ORIENTATION=+